MNDLLAPTLSKKCDYTQAVIFALFIYLGGLIAVYFGRDLSWDVANYHFYNPYAFLHARDHLDFWPVSFIHRYFSPTPDLLSYYLIQHFAPKLAVFVMGALHGLNMALVYVIARLFIVSRYQTMLAILFALLGMGGALVLPSMGGFENDNTASIFILLFIYIFLRACKNYPTEVKKLYKPMCVAGCSLGIALGIKLTSASYVVGALLATLFLSMPFYARCKLSFYLLLFTALGWLLVSGYWMLLLWQHFHNPLFPFFNALFHSSYFPAINFNYSLFFPHTLEKILFFPLYFSWHGTRADTDFIDLRFATMFVLFIGLAVKWLYHKLSHAKTMPLSLLSYWLFSFVIFSYIAWESYFSIVRYLAPTAMLAPLIIYLQLSRLCQNDKLFTVVLSVLFIVMIGTLKFPLIIRSPVYPRSYFNITLPEKIRQVPQALVLMAYPAYALDNDPKPQTYLIPFFPPGWQFKGIPFYAAQPSQLQPHEYKKITQFLSSTSHPIYLLASDTTMPRLIAFAKQWHLNVSGQCSQIKSDRQVISASLTLLCPMSRPAFAAAQSASCDLINKISNDIQISADETGVSSWNISQLKQKLGTPSDTKILGTDYFYEWKSLIAFQAADGSGSGSGYYPGFDAKNGIQAAVKALGKPLMQVTNHLTQYEWRCSPQSWLVVAAYDNQNVKKASGESCSNGKCLPFSVKFKTMSQAETAYQQQLQLHSKEIIQNGFNLFVRPYNEYFHVTMANREQLTSDMRVRQNRYFQSIGKCQPGEYAYARLAMGGGDIRIERSSVLGEQNGHCLVNTTWEKENVLVVCRYPMNTLSVFTAFGAPNADQSMFGDLASEIDNVTQANCEYKTIVPEKQP